MYEVTRGVLRADSTSFWESYSNINGLQIKGQRFLETDHEGDFNHYKLKIPLIMLLEPRSTFGCPDCYDQGGYLLDFTIFGIRRQFRIDKDHQPVYYRKLTYDIDDKIKEIEKEFKNFNR